ncbi:hypothetical protein GOV13_00695 [Candidatus Pacearchaeota archaeon]|nr:hypothetical protein [Candidatus Pacearchaeota archaeon]
MNKRGTDKIISVYWFAILFIVAAAVVYMAAVFYGTPYDIRGAEASAMINQIADCITEGNSLKNVSQETFMDACHLNFGEENDEYYVKVSNPDVEKGNVNLKEFCDKKGDKLPKCVDRKLYILGGEVVEIKVVVNKVK